MLELILVPLSDAEREAFIAEDIAGYAEQQIRDAGWRPPDALDRARTELLPLLRREHAHAGDDRLWTALGPDRSAVGWLWTQPPQPAMPAGSAFLYQITVRQALRGRGYGRAMLAALEAQLRLDGVDVLELNVNDGNTVARRLYESSGYTLVEQLTGKRRLRKHLTPERQ